MIIGSLITKRRKQKGLSQDDLASGICTQATLSKLEAKNLPPRADILVSLCQRLDLTLNDIFTEFNDPSSSSDALFYEIERHNTLYEYKESKRLLKKLSLNSLTKNQSLIYHYLKANIAMFADNDLEEAQFGLGIVLQQINMHKQPYLHIASLCQLGVSYAISGANNKAKYYFNQVEKSLKTIDSVPSQETFPSLPDTKVKVYTNMSEFFSQMEKFQKSTSMANTAIQIYAEANRIPNIEKLAYEVAFNNWKQGMDNSQNAKAINRSEVFADFNNDKVIKGYIQYLRENDKFFEPDES